MSADLEQDLRELFAADAARAPVAHDLADRARSRARERGRRERRVAVLAICRGGRRGDRRVRPGTPGDGPLRGRRRAAHPSPRPPTASPRTMRSFRSSRPCASTTSRCPCPPRCSRPRRTAVRRRRTPPMSWASTRAAAPPIARGAPRVTTVVLQPWRAVGIPRRPAGGDEHPARRTYADGDPNPQQRSALHRHLTRPEASHQALQRPEDHRDGARLPGPGPRTDGRRPTVELRGRRRGLGLRVPAGLAGRFVLAGRRRRAQRRGPGRAAGGVVRAVPQPVGSPSRGQLGRPPPPAGR